MNTGNTPSPNSGINSLGQFGQNKIANKHELIKKIDSFLQEYSKKVHFDTHLTKIIRKIQRGRKEFDATRFFVLVAGPVKSGKSTLVNIFARTYVSPTAYKECTALPTIIGMSDGYHLNKIVQFIPTEKNSSDPDKIETFNYIVDVIREVEDNDMLEGRVSVIESELTENNIDRIIAISDPQEKKDELVVSVGIKGGGFIDHEIVLIDMPGLDGAEVNKDSMPVYKAMAERADLIFFVQSTTSAINNESIEFLTSLFDKRSALPMLLIHNKHESQYFIIDDEEKRKQLEEQINTGKERIIKTFNKNNFDGIALNLGKIDAWLNEREKIKPEYTAEIENEFARFLEIEKKWIDILKTEKQEMKDATNISYNIDILKESVIGLEQITAGYNSQRETIEHSIDTVNALYHQFDKVQIRDTSFLAEYDELIKKENIENSWAVRIASTVKEMYPNSGEEITGRELKEKIDKIVMKSSEKIPTGKGTQFRNLLESVLESSLLTETLQLPITNIEEKIKTLNHAGFEIDTGIDFKALSYMPESFTPNYSDIREKKTYLKVINIQRKYSKAEQEEYLDWLKEYLIHHIPIKLQEYRDILKSDFTTIRDKLLEDIKNQIRQYARQYEVDKTEKLTLLKSESTLINEISDQLKSILHP